MSGLRIGIVVATHPEDHSVDLVMADDGSRLVGVQVLSGSASARSGTVDMPAVPEKADKWDITKETGQDMKAVVGFVGRHPVVTGFLYPQINQVLSKDAKLRYSRHQSDVEWSIDGDGNIQLTHPGGAYVRIGEAADKVDLAGKNADANSAADRNTGKKVNVRIGLAGNAVVLTLTPDGDVTIKLDKDLSIEAGGNASIKVEGTAMVEAGGPATVKAPSVTLDTPATLCTGALTVNGLLTYAGGMSGSGGGTAAIITGNVQVQGNINATGSIIDAGGNTNHHSH